MSSIERSGRVLPVGWRDPFNHASKLPTEVLPPKAQHLRSKIGEGIKLLGAFAELHERIPGFAEPVYDQKLGIRLDNDVSKVDSWMYAAQNAVDLYDVLLSTVGDVQVKSPRIESIRNGEADLGRAIMFFESMRTMAPEMLDSNSHRSAHSSFVLSYEGVLALSYLSKPAPNAGSSQEAIDDYRMKRRLAKSLLKKDPYAGRLYKQNRRLFNGNALRQREPVHTGQYL